MQAKLVEEEREGLVKYLTYKGSLFLDREDKAYKLVKYKYHELVVKYIDVENNNVINDNSAKKLEGKNVCLAFKEQT